MMAAGRAAECGANVLLLEKTGQPGQKILISGKTRCNLTNAKELDEFITMYGPNGNFLYHAFNHFFRKELLEFLSRYGVETKTERGGRIFPVSDDARDVVKAFAHYLTDHKVQIKTGVNVIKITRRKRMYCRSTNGYKNILFCGSCNCNRRCFISGYRFHRRWLSSGLGYRPYRN